MGLFPYYEGSAGASEAAGDSAVNQQATYNTLQTNLDSRSAAAADETAYAITEPVAMATKSVEADAGEIGASALLAGGAIKYFAQAIRTYNGHIDDLNSEYETAKANNFYVAADAGAEEGMTGSEKDAAYDTAVAGADADLKARLETERQGYEDVLNEAGDYAGGLLASGPTDSALLSLYLLGTVSGEDVAAATGMTLAVLSNMRTAAATSNFVLTSPKWMPALTQYLLHINPASIKGRIDMQVAMQIRKITQMSTAQGLSFAQRVAAYKNAKVDTAAYAKLFGSVLRGENVVNAATPGALFGKYGANLKYFGTASKWAGRVLAPLAIAAGAYGLYQTSQNWDELSTDHKVTGVVGNSAFIIAGVGGTAALASLYATTWSFPPLGAAVTLVAGAVALGCYVYDNWDSISNFVTDTVPDALSTAWDASSNFVTDTVPDALDTAWDASTDWAGDRMDDIGDGFSNAADGLGDLTGLW